MEKELNLIIDRLRSKQQTVSFAESCTGGRIAAAFTAIPGVSEVFHGSCVTYANRIKSEWLGVSSQTLEVHGAVSRPCVEEMLQGIQQMAQSDYAIAVSGIAGPDGGTAHKPVGTVYIGLLTPEGMTVEKCHFSGDREAIQEAAKDYAVTLFAKKLEIA